MSYTKTNWQTGDVISKARLNHAEQGIYDNAEDITELKNDLNYNHTAEPGYVLRATDSGHGNEWALFGTPTDAQAETAINAWLDEHPEATTTVQDYSLTHRKLINGTLGFVIPEMFGATGNGEVDDTTALNSAFAFGLPVLLPRKYKVDGVLTADGATVFGGELFFSSNTALKDATNFTKSRFINVKFSSVNNQDSPWLENGKGKYSNIRIKSTDCDFYKCVFDKLECLNVTDSSISNIVNCQFTNCAEGITSTKTNNIFIKGCYFDLLTYSGNLAHALYIASDIINCDVSDSYFTNCIYYPFHFYNSNTAKQNPQNVSIQNCTVDDCNACIAFNGAYLYVNNLKVDNTSSFLYLGGTSPYATIKNSYVDSSGSLGSFASGITNPTIELDSNILKIDLLLSNSVDSISLTSKNNHYSDSTVAGTSAAMMRLNRMLSFVSIGDYFTYNKYYSSSFIVFASNNTRFVIVNPTITYTGSTQMTIFYDSGTADSISIVNPVVVGKASMSYQIDSSNIYNPVLIAA